MLLILDMISLMNSTVDFNMCIARNCMIFVEAVKDQQMSVSYFASTVFIACRSLIYILIVYPLTNQYENVGRHLKLA